MLSALSQVPNLEDQVPVFMSPGDRVAQFYSEAPGSFSSPSTTRRATMEVFQPASNGKKT
jgi:hypothetical protein